jgi:cyclopropane-fatty-acyl-phospholipid synthase
MIDQLISKGILPDFLLKKGINSLLKKRLKDEYGDNFDGQDKKRQEIIEELKQSPIAIETDKANDQHYMVPPKFFELCLGKHLKYSCGYWDKSTNLDDAEREMLELTIERSGIQDGDKILELGHGWGAITLFMAEKFPNSQITAVSNSKLQGEFILDRAAERNLSNIKIQTEDMRKLSLNEKYDRVISIEMFEHMRNYKDLLNRIDSWLNPEGTLFVHIFVHKELSYKFDIVDDTDWMSKYFFSGGIMPSEHLLYYFKDDLVVDKHWRVLGTHYAKTARGWLENMDNNKEEIMDLFVKHYPEGEALKWFNYWRVFFLSCEGLWGYKEGKEWFVCHYLLKKNKLKQG